MFLLRSCIAGALLLTLATGSAASTDPDKVVVTRGGVSVTFRDVDNFVARVPKEQRANFIDSPSRIRDLLSNLLLTKQLAAQARSEHLDQRPEISAQLRASEDEVLARARMADYMVGIKVPDLSKLVAEQYAAHKDLYKVPASFDVKHILVGTDKRSDEEAKALADKLRAQAAADPKKFDALVDEFSDDPSKVENHGLMTDATDKKYAQDFRDAASSLTRVGEISPVIHTTYGYHVLQLVAKKPERQQSLAEVREALTKSMQEQYVADQRRELITQLTNEKVEADPATLDSLRDRYDEAGDVKVADGAPAAPGNANPAPPAPAKHPR